MSYLSTAVSSHSDARTYKREWRHFSAIDESIILSKALRHPSQRVYSSVSSNLGRIVEPHGWFRLSRLRPSSHKISYSDLAVLSDSRTCEPSYFNFYYLYSALTDHQCFPLIALLNLISFLASSLPNLASFLLSHDKEGKGSLLLTTICDLAERLATNSSTVARDSTREMLSLLESLLCSMPDEAVSRLVSSIDVNELVDHCFLAKVSLHT